jgi:hypothetical protein
VLRNELHLVRNSLAAYACKAVRTHFTLCMDGVHSLDGADDMTPPGFLAVAGVCALNIEAMSVMKRGMPPAGSNPFFAQNSSSPGAATGNFFPP